MYNSSYYMCTYVCTLSSCLELICICKGNYIYVYVQYNFYQTLSSHGYTCMHVLEKYMMFYN